MDTKNDETRRTWSELTALARNAQPPAIDVRHAVMSGIRHQPAAPAAPPSILATVEVLFGRGLAKPALALFAVACGTIGYAGCRGLDLIELVASFSL